MLLPERWQVRMIGTFESERMNHGVNDKIETWSVTLGVMKAEAVRTTLW